MVQRLSAVGMTTQQNGQEERRGQETITDTVGSMQVAAFAHLTGDEKRSTTAATRFKTCWCQSDSPQMAAFAGLRRTKPYGTRFLIWTPPPRSVDSFDSD